MANVLKYLTGALSKRAKRRGNLAVGIGEENYGPSSTTGYFNGVTPPDGGFVVYATGSNSNPKVFVAETEDDLPAIARTLGGGVLTVREAKNYIDSLSHSWVLDSIPSNTITDGLVLDLNAKNMSSFTDNEPTTNLAPTSVEKTGGNEYLPYCQIQDILDTYGTGSGVQFYVSFEAKAPVPGNLYMYTGDSSQRKYNWDGVNFSVTTKFQRFELPISNVTIYNANYTVNRLSFYGTYGSGRIPTVRNVQIERKTYATDFVSGSRLQNTTWKDISGNGYDVTLVNQPTYNSNGYISFNGIDQRGDQSGLPSVDLTTEYYTMEVVCRFPTLPTTTIDGAGGDGGPIYGARQGSDYILFAYASSSDASALGVSYDDSRNNATHATNKTINAGEWVKFTQIGIPHFNGTYWVGKFKYYINGVLDHDETISADGNGYGIPTTFYLAYDARYNDYGEVDIASIKRYNRELTPEEISQNYYGGPIVTDGLVLAMDAGNLVSYESGSTTVYSMTGSLSGSLVNGVGFSNNKGGSWVLDGTDDWIDLGNQSLISGDFCIDLWYQLTETKSEHYIFTTGYSSAGSILIFSGGVWLNSSATDGRMPGAPGGVINEITNITVERTNGVAKWYKNGIYQYSLNYSGSISANTNYGIGWAVPRNKSTAYMSGEFYSVKMYNKGFSSAEILQNYNAQKSRFGK